MCKFKNTVFVSQVINLSNKKSILKRDFKYKDFKVFLVSYSTSKKINPKTKENKIKKEQPGYIIKSLQLGLGSPDDRTCAFDALGLAAKLLTVTQTLTPNHRLQNFDELVSIWREKGMEILPYGLTTHKNPFLSVVNESGGIFLVCLRFRSNNPVYQERSDHLVVYEASKSIFIDNRPCDNVVAVTQTDRELLQEPNSRSHVKKLLDEIVGGCADEVRVSYKCTFQCFNTSSFYWAARTCVKKMQLNPTATTLKALEEDHHVQFSRIKKDVGFVGLFIVAVTLSSERKVPVYFAFNGGKDKRLTILEQPYKTKGRGFDISLTPEGLLRCLCDGKGVRIKRVWRVTITQFTFGKRKKGLLKTVVKRRERKEEGLKRRRKRNQRSTNVESMT